MTRSNNEGMRAPDTVLMALWAVWFISWMLASVWRDRAAAQPSRLQQSGYRLLAMAGASLLFGSFPVFWLAFVLWTTPAPAGWALVGIGGAGLAFTWWARIHLGRLWSANVGRKADHRVVDTGPYGIVRHPIYTGITLAAMATAALRGTAGAWLGVAVMTFGWYVKARLEERFLREQLGAEAYGAYARRVPMLVPFLR
jgi:protein-S-isoprenylcysteine O-methyltransferase Ste14